MAKMKKIVINDSYGGFGLSPAALRLMSGHPDCGHIVGQDHRGPRDCPYLVQVVEDFGEKANGITARLKVIEIPDDIEWVIEEYDGMERVVLENTITWE